MPDLDFDFDLDVDSDGDFSSHSSSGSVSDIASAADIDAETGAKSKRKSVLSSFESTLMGANLWLSVVLVLGGIGWVLSVAFPWNSYVLWGVVVVVLAMAWSFYPGFWRECNRGRIFAWLGFMFLGAINLLIVGIIALALGPEEPRQQVIERLRVMTGEQAPEQAAPRE